MSENILNLSELRRDLQKSWCHDSVADITISRDDIYDLLSKLDVSKSCGPDEVPARLLRGARWLADPLTRLYNISVRVRVVFPVTGRPQTSLRCSRREANT